MEKTTTFYWLSFGFQLEIVTLVFDSKEARDNRADFERSQGHEVFTGESLNTVEIFDSEILAYAATDIDMDELLEICDGDYMADYLETFHNYFTMPLASLNDTIKADYLRENWNKLALPLDIPA